MTNGQKAFSLSLSLPDIMIANKHNDYVYF